MTVRGLAWASAAGIALLAAVAVVASACGPAGPTPQLVPPDEVITMGPSVPPTPVPPDVAAAAEAEAAFEELLADPKLSYHVKGSGSDVLLDRPQKWSIEADVSGAEWDGTAKAGGGSVRFAYVDGKGWVKVKGAKWFPLPIQTSAIPDIVLPWGYLCPRAAVTYTEPAAKPAGAFTYSCKPDYTIQTQRMQRAGLTVTIDELTLVLAADGKPVALTVAGQYPGNASRLAESFTLKLAFSKVGKPVKVTGP
jgi:hypothetical protein